MAATSQAHTEAFATKLSQLGDRLREQQAVREEKIAERTAAFAEKQRAVKQLEEEQMEERLSLAWKVQVGPAFVASHPSSLLPEGSHHSSRRPRRRRWKSGVRNPCSSNPRRASSGLRHGWPR